jgi:HSP20 family protein
VDIIEKKDEWVFKGELPDVKPEDIQVTIEEGVLVIKGERKFEEEVQEGSYTRFERQYGSFERRFSLPSSINPDKIKADYKNGILTLRVPKKEEAKPKSIKIES